MFFYTISIAAAIFVLMIVIFRLLIHFYFCRRISFRYPGEKLKGCPIWTHTEEKGNGENGGNEESSAAANTHHISAKMKNSNQPGETSSETGRKQHHFSNLFPATPPGN